MNKRIEGSGNEEDAEFSKYLEEGRNVIERFNMSFISEKEKRDELYSMTRDYASNFELGGAFPRDTPQSYDFEDFRYDMVKIEHQRILGGRL